MCDVQLTLYRLIAVLVTHVILLAILHIYFGLTAISTEPQIASLAILLYEIKKIILLLSSVKTHT